MLKVKDTLRSTVNLTYDGSATAPTNAGSYTVVATVSNANYQAVTTDTLVMMPMLFRGAPMPSSLPSTGGNDTGVAGLALLLVVAGAAILRLVRRPA